MSRPLLQLALDHSSLEAAQRDVTQLKDSVDIVEAGTILCLNEGLDAVKALREQCPDKIIVADWKVADAGETLATGIVLACGRRFIIAVVMHRPAGNSGAKPIWHA